MDDTAITKNLERFWAVTTSRSVYKVDLYRNGEPKPALTKLVNDGRDQGDFEPGDSVEGPVMVVAQLLFMPDPGVLDFAGLHRGNAGIPKNHWVANTSPIVGLFLDIEPAMNALEYDTLQFCDPIFKDDTVATLRAIGAHHPLCWISMVDDRLWLMPPGQWLQKQPA